MPQKCLPKKDLATILLGVGTSESPVQWFKDLSNTVREREPISYDGDKSLRIVQKMMLLLRECLLTHRWDEVAHIMKHLTTYNHLEPVAVWKVGTELLTDHISEFHKCMRLLSDLNVTEVVLEYILYLQEKGDLETIKEILKGDARSRKIQVTDRMAYVNVLLRAYTGLTWYIEWCLCQRDRETHTTSGQEETDQADLSGLASNDFMDSMLLSQSSLVSNAHKDMLMKTYAQKAVASFETLTAEPGVWDIFVTKHVEILEVGQQLDEARAVLDLYLEKNPDNPNAHKYLYRFCCSHDNDPKLKMKLLKDIAKRVPSDPLVLDLCQQLKAESISEPLLYLFTLLDYSCWQTELPPWMMLHDLLDQSNRANDSAMAVWKECWESRESWWPDYHFTAYRYKECQNIQNLAFIKAVVACVLCGKDNAFVTEAKKYMDEEELQKLMNTEKTYKIS